MFTPLTHFKIRPLDNVGNVTYNFSLFIVVAVYGIGGLGHLGLQFAKAMGCTVTAISSGSEKETEARQFGASHYVNTQEAGALKKIYNTLDAILVTGDK
jgi:uncharacterized zinc-type alcohol dehydrogenase-like protein